MAALPRLSIVENKFVDVIELIVGEEVAFCDTCAKAKHLCDNFPKEREDECKTEHGALTYLDVWIHANFTD